MELFSTLPRATKPCSEWYLASFYASDQLIKWVLQQQVGPWTRLANILDLIPFFGGGFGVKAGAVEGIFLGIFRLGLDMTVNDKVNENHSEFGADRPWFCCIGYSVFISDSAMVWMNFLPELLKPSPNWWKCRNSRSSGDSIQHWGRWGRCRIEGLTFSFASWLVMCLTDQVPDR